MQSGSSLSYSQRSSCLKFFRKIYQEEGVKGLYRVGWRQGLHRAFEGGGVTQGDGCQTRSVVPVRDVCVHPASPCAPLQGVGPTVQRAAVLAGVLLPSYDLCKKTFLGWGLDDRITAQFM